MIIISKYSLRISLLFFTLAIGIGQVSQEGTPYSFDHKLSGEIPVMRMPVVDVEALLLEDENRPSGTPFRYGETLPLNLLLDNPDVWVRLPNGDKLWQMQIESAGAFAISLMFNRFFLPPKSTFFVYSPDRKTVYGAYTELNNNPDNIFATPLIPGDIIILEIVTPSSGEEVELSNAELIHDYRDILNFFETARDRSCGENVACPDADPYEEQIDATAWLLMGSWMCSGAMINNANYDLTPYFLTAWHCVDDLSPGIFKFYFNYETPGCSGNNASYGSYAYGSILRASSDANTYPMDPDFALLEITGNVYESWNVFYSGWNRSYSAPLISCGVHHPGGDPKKINYENDYATNSPGINWTDEGYSPPGSHWSVAWDEGGTEGGSSGSPVFDDDGRIVGQLSGGGGSCVTGDNTYYGKFSRSWNNGSSSSTRLKDWLDPDNTGVSNIDGTYDGAPANPEITVISPNGGEDWEIGSSNLITWSSANAGNYVKIEMFLSGSFYATIAPSTYNGGYYNWSIPAGHDPSSSYKVKITDAGDSSTYDYSDSYFTLSGDQVITVDYLSGWNVVGLPLVVEDANVSTIFPEAIDGTLYSFDEGYILDSTLWRGEGYWLRFNNIGSTTIYGIPINELTISLNEGWNLISGISSTIGLENIIDPSEIIVEGTLYGYDGQYFSSDNIVPGQGYWLRTNAAGDITLFSARQSAKTKPFLNHLEGSNIFEFTNDTHSAALYFGKDVPEGEELSYSLPPVFPQMAFDARFTDDMKYTRDTGEISVINTNSSLSVHYTVNMMAEDGKEWVFTTENGEEHILEGTGTITFTGNINGMTLSQKIGVIPAAYALHQNYPNPFNPVTTLRYDLPTEDYVTITIYDLNGKEISQLVNTNQPAGQKSVQWNATDRFGKPVSAGVYLYQIQAGEFTQTRKMVLLK